MGYCDFTEAEMIALTRQRRAEARARRIASLPPTLRFSVHELNAERARRRQSAMRAEKRLRYERPEKRHPSLLPDTVFRAIWALQDGRCYMCAADFTDADWATQDHVVPRSRGGADGGNILLACALCNNVKADRDPKPCELLYLAGVTARLPAAFECVEMAA